MHKTKSGFTIVELLIVIVVIGVLAAITVVAYNQIAYRARSARVYQQFSQGRTKVEAEYQENGQWPFEEALRVELASTDDESTKNDKIMGILSNYFGGQLKITGGSGVNGVGSYSSNAWIDGQGQLHWVFGATVVKPFGSGGGGEGATSYTITSDTTSVEVH